MASSIDDVLLDMKLCHMRRQAKRCMRSFADVLYLLDVKDEIPGAFNTGLTAAEVSLKLLLEAAEESGTVG